MYSFDKQIEWLENKLSHMDDLIEREDDSKVKSYLQDERNMIFVIISEYKKAKEDSSTLSWIEYPDMMGR